MERVRLLDLTRSLRRADRVATGIDRVERAYLERFLKDDIPAYGLMRTAFGYLLLNKQGMQLFETKISGFEAWGTADLWSHLTKTRNKTLKQAETDVRRIAVARCLPSGLQQMLQRHLTEGFAYYNTGHSNLTERVLGGVKQAKGQIHVLVHDVIPLEFPEFQRPGTIKPFKDKIQRVSTLADRVIYNSHDTRSRTETVMQDWGRIPQAIVAHLGTIPPVADPQEVPDGVMPDRPYFITVGTIEPRKNHAFLLSLWEKMGPDAPPLLVCGTRGWNNEAVFTRLDALLKDSPIKEVANLSDPALSALVQGSAGMLFPSITEGYGLPPVEAISLKTRVLCNDLDVLREILKQYATFVPISDEKKWIDTIKKWEENPQLAEADSEFEVPSWADHFEIVLGST